MEDETRVEESGEVEGVEEERRRREERGEREVEEESQTFL